MNKKAELYWSKQDPLNTCFIEFFIYNDSNCEHDAWRANVVF